MSWRGCQHVHVVELQGRASSASPTCIAPRGYGVVAHWLWRPHPTWSREAADVQPMGAC